MNINRIRKQTPAQAKSALTASSPREDNQWSHVTVNDYAITNAQLAELLAQKAETVRSPLTRAFRRASRRAFLWPEEAYSLQQRGGSLTELQGVGPYLEKQIKTWVGKKFVRELEEFFVNYHDLQGEKYRILDVKGPAEAHRRFEDGMKNVRKRKS